LKPIDGYDLAGWQKIQNSTAAVALVTMPTMKCKGCGPIVHICSAVLNGGW